MTIANKADLAYKAVMDLYYCEHCGAVRRINEGFSRKPNEPAVFYVGAVISWCYSCLDYQKFIKLA